MVEAHRSSSTRRRQTPAWITSWILSLVPSDRYDSAQHASVSTSSSFEWISLASVGSASLVCAQQAQNILNSSMDGQHFWMDLGRRWQRQHGLRQVSLTSDVPVQPHLRQRHPCYQYGQV